MPVYKRFNENNDICAISGMNRVNRFIFSVVSFVEIFSKFLIAVLYLPMLYVVVAYRLWFCLPSWYILINLDFRYFS